MELIGSASSTASLCIPQAVSRDATAPDRWTSFLQCYDAFIARELAQEHPQFASALRQLQRETRLEQERHSAQVLATLRVKDAKILELQRVLGEQREQLDVVLDELERRETKEDVAVQVDAQERRLEDASVQTEDTKKQLEDAETQTVQMNDQSGVFNLLEKLEKELQTLEHKNSVLERELQTRIPKREVKETEEEQVIEICLETLQRGVDAMNLSCNCVDYPLAFFVGSDRKDERLGSSTCVNLEHRLEAQAVRLEHVQECLYMWREAAVQVMKRGNEKEGVSGPSLPPNLLIVRSWEKCDTGEVNCAVALRGALFQIRQCIFERRGRRHVGGQSVLEDMARVLAKGKSGAKVAAKMVQKWAGWEAKHLDEMRNLRQGFAEERAVALSRRTALMKRIDQLEQRELDLQAEVRTLRKTFKVKGETLTSISPSNKPSRLLLGTSKCNERVEYSHLVLRLATAGQSLLAKDEQLTAANTTIRALSSCASTSMHPSKDELCSSDPITFMNRLAVDLQSTSKQKLEFFRRRERELINVGQYFQMEKSCLQLESRLEAEQKRTAMLEAAKLVCERERDELEMRVEKLETEAVLATVTRESESISLPSIPQDDSVGFAEDPNVALFFALKRLRLVEDDRKILRERLRHFQQQVALMTQQRANDNREDIVNDRVVGAGILECIENHHQACVGHLKKFCDRHQLSTTVPDGTDDGGKPESDWETLLSHYEALWISFHVIYSFLVQLPQLMTNDSFPLEVDAEYDLMLRAFGCQPVAGKTCTPHGHWQESLQTLELELSKKDEAILILKQQLLKNEERARGWNYLNNCNEDVGYQLHERGQPSINLAERDLRHKRGADFAGLMHNASRQDSNLPETTHPIMVLKPQESPLQSDSMSSNGSGNGITLLTSDSEANGNSMVGREKSTESTATELQECLAKCAYLASQNSKLTRRLRAEKETNKTFVMERKELQSQLDARTEANSEMRQTLEKYHAQDVTSITHRNPSVDVAKDEREKEIDGAVDGVTSTKISSKRSEEDEALREQLASREQENLTLVQSLCTIKEKCAQMEVVRQKELRLKTAEHAEGMEKYMTTVNATLSRIESDKHRLEDENVKLRTKLQQLEDDNARRELEQSQRSAKGTNTDHEVQFLDIGAYTQEKDTLVARVQDLEFQLARERKLTEAMEQKKHLENQQEEQQESNAKMAAAKTKQNYELRCEALHEWRNKLQHEFTENQAVQHAAQQESDRRIEFLSACVEEYVRLADATPATSGKTVSTKELYEAVMELAGDPPRISGRGIVSSSQSRKQPKQRPSPSLGSSNQQTDAAARDYSWNDLLLSKKPEETDLNENDTFEDTIRKLEISMTDVKEELLRRLARETQLVSTLTLLKTELATTKDQAALLAERCQVANVELEKRQGEATSRGDETQRARMAIQRKTELLSQQKTKVALLQQELELAAKKLERLAVAERQSTLLQQKAKEHTQQLLHVRQSYERCHDDNIQLSVHLEKAKERNSGVMTRLKAARAENAQLRSQFSDLKKSAQADPGIDAPSKDSRRDNQAELNAVSIASLTEEARALKRRVLQKQDVIVSYKAKLADYDSQLERQRDTMVKLARTNRELQQGQRQRQQQEQEFTSALHDKLEIQLNVQQEELDGLRASIYDSFEAFVFCRPSSAPKSQSFLVTGLESPPVNDVSDDEQLFDIKRWTDFSAQDLEELRLARGPRRSRHKDGSQDKLGKRNLAKRKSAVAALRDVEGALEVTPEDCRAEICELLQCLCGE